MLEALVLEVSVPQRKTILSRDIPVKFVTFRRPDMVVLSVTVFTVVALEAKGPA